MTPEEELRIRRAERELLTSELKRLDSQISSLEDTQPYDPEEIKAHLESEKDDTRPQKPLIYPDQRPRRHDPFG